ncbi:putative S-adenosyl-L-methionine-dependent methyltransferase [Helianthus debilis subsp. tardiflorus]
MPVGKSRASKRPSGGSSSSSTATLLVLMFMSIFGVWMLTSNSVVTPPRQKSIVHKETSHSDSIHHNPNLPQKIPSDQTATVFEDIPGDLPADALKEEDEHNKDERDTIPFKQHTEKLKTAKNDTEKEGGKQAKDNVDMYKWELCNVTTGMDYIPCLDNEIAISKLRSKGHYEHRERHCPDEGPTCLVPLPEGYKKPIPWPASRNKIWFHNVPHKDLAKVKGHQNWVKATGEFLTFPGGGTQFIHGALHYIDFVQQMVPEIAWGKHTRVILDVGCGVASFGGFLFDKNVLTMSFAPKDEHEAQVQFALERGIPAISAVMGTQRLPFPYNVFDLVHCARCRVPWHIEGGKLLLELNRVLRPGGYFVWSATPVYRKEKEDVQIWKEMSALTVAMCWKLISIKKDKLNLIGVAVYQKPNSNECYSERKKQEPPMCKPDDDPNASWYVPLQICMHKVPSKETERGSQWPEEWPERVLKPPYWLNKNPLGIYGKPTPKDFEADYEYWKRVVSNTYMHGLGVNWSNVRNVMDMRAVYGGFAAALKDLKLWVMNVVNIDSPDTLPLIYERGLFGIYHDWCESFSTYPRTYDLLHADHLFSKLKNRCKTIVVITEVDRIVRPGGKLIIRDKSNMIEEIKNLLKSLHWEILLTFSKNEEQILSAQKSTWRPKTYTTPS